MEPSLQKNALPILTTIQFCILWAYLSTPQPSMQGGGWCGVLLWSVSGRDSRCDGWSGKFLAHQEAFVLFRFQRVINVASALCAPRPADWCRSCLGWRGRLGTYLYLVFKWKNNLLVTLSFLRLILTINLFCCAFQEKYLFSFYLLFQILFSVLFSPQIIWSISKTFDWNKTMLEKFRSGGLDGRKL